jgi:hypothetical protein
MDFELENVLTQPWLASRANQKAKWVGGGGGGGVGVQHEDFLEKIEF